MAGKYDTESFMSRAKQVHGDRYDYSEVCYVAAKKKVRIRCKDHGVFLQTPDKHVRARQKCPACAGRPIQTTESFIRHARLVHGIWYDYSEVVYTNNKTHVRILCPEHGEFRQVPCSHLSGNGCTYCAAAAKRSCQAKSGKAFIRDAIAVHGDKYDYSGVVYKNAYTPVEISCPKHGAWLVRPANHTNISTGCPSCKESKGEAAIARRLESLGVPFERQWRHPDCTRTGSTRHVLSFDFKTDVGLIEYDGEFHFKDHPFKPGSLPDVQARDAFKTSWAARNNHRLLRIPYTEFEDINVILSEWLNASL